MPRTRPFASVERALWNGVGRWPTRRTRSAWPAPHPSKTFETWAPVTLAVDQVNTVVYSIPDQSELYGLLSRLRALGIEVVEARRILDPGSSSERIDIDPDRGDDEPT